MSQSSGSSPHQVCDSLEEPPKPSAEDCTWNAFIRDPIAIQCIRDSYGSITDWGPTVTPWWDDVCESWAIWHCWLWCQPNSHRQSTSVWIAWAFAAWSAAQKVQRVPCNTIFRFGNGNTVECHEALLVPLSRWNVKVRIVQSKTPVLISNNVFRTLGAQIDTANDAVTFAKISKCLYRSPPRSCIC